MFEKNYLGNLDLKGVNIGVMQFHTQFTYVSRHSGAKNSKKKKFWKNRFENVVSDL